MKRAPRFYNIFYKAGKNGCENKNYEKYHVKWDVKSYLHGKGKGNQPVEMDVKAATMRNGM